MPTIKLADGQTFHAGDNTPLLDAALAAGVLLPYGCRTGRCSTCKAKVLQGKTHPVLEESSITQNEKASGWILTCARVAENDVVLEAEGIRNIQLPTPKTFPCRISHLEYLTHDVIKVRLRLPPTSTFISVPGQYIDIIGPNGLRRSYSLASTNSDDKNLEIHIRAVDGGLMSRYWFREAKINDLLRLNGPLGTFFLRETADIDLIFLATGTGIAPIKAMLESLVDLPTNKSPRSVMVLWGGRTSEDLYLDVAAIPGNHTYIPVQSRPNEIWSGARGYIQDVLLRLNLNLSKAVVYACGSDKMIHSAQKSLLAAGLSPQFFYSDAFVSSGNN